MNEHGTRHTRKAFLVADMDFTGPLPVVRQFCIFSENPYHEPGLGPLRMWAVVMVREADSFARAKDEILHDLETSAESFPVYRQVLRFLDEAPDAETHALKYRLPQALDAYIATMPAPDHPFFKGLQPESDGQPLLTGEERYFGEVGASLLERTLYPDAGITVR